MSDLRSKLIRLAHENPELRPLLLPLVTKKGSSEVNDAVYEGALAVARELFGRDATRDQVTVILQAMQGMKPKLEALYEENQAPRGLDVGSFFVSSWGYNQTNISYYEVQKITPKMVVVRKVQNKIVRSSGTYDYVVPVKGQYRGRAMRKKLGVSYDGKPSITISSYEYARLWDGKPQAQTDPRYGH